MSGEAFGQTQDRLMVDVWSDVMCPFCYMGDTLLGQALESFPHKEHVEVRYHSFLLVPGLPDTPVDIDEVMTGRRSTPGGQVNATFAKYADRFRRIGLEYQYERIQAVQTYTAHELSHFAASHGKQHEMLKRLFKAYFVDGLNVADHQVLADLATEVGLDRDSALAALASGGFTGAVDADLQRARDMGISGVPFFVFAGKYAVSGAQSVEAFGQALETSWNETVGAPAGAER
ncbi:DsbA family protein [Streptomyces sp. PT12]|uniref:DsbA family oxidoreductase n=1 Tax=Streptomyces sp. PT12 TaxID=1510197 RepID=UPI000DE2BC21|nr:DsbA family oxidoreductase [Streptomyces sp. PT12]RBM19475.1 protein-disulfide isomerase [Streptomyces sp. PT12]